ncbi:hypothetical protein GCM10010112_63190 [Actinoplanes lobatus]|uniref:Uncharacterized protein n=1 Tax=Actinoplanes lobatus TaxID=113568 RepID=A0A7W7HKD3_9ACTN|nr:hypothetical protein [Actinoplanes lobatus]MBB4752135.1 hypothetical protein [Actinoplanes lobatus]GGN84148.1 hypothetical protein GCM10010112_63190 [Actinoplanes lobatus]GIE44097.1 hypothetical protein Alo02nite_69950 [Actinoplanes lobatus]
MPQQSHPATDISAVTPAQRAQILREESDLLEEKMMRGGIDTQRDVLVALRIRIDELEEVRTAD